MWTFLCCVVLWVVLYCIVLYCIVLYCIVLYSSPAKYLICFHLILAVGNRVVYKIPDGYVYELPEVFSSASLAATSPAGIPQRQGIIHRELLYQHALVCYQNYLFCLSEEMYNSSGIPEVMFRNARCEVEVVEVPGKNKKGKKIQKINLNTILRRMSYQRELDVVHPCFLNDFYIKEIIAPPFVYYTTIPKCFQCKKTQNLFYCSLCRKRQVQIPHVYCSKVRAEGSSHDKEARTLLYT